MKFLLPALILVIFLVVVFRSKPKITVPANARAGDLILRPCDYKTKTHIAPSAGLSSSPSLASLNARA